jgi:hypothetical protein
MTAAVFQIFPSLEDRKQLQEQRKKIGLAAFSLGDRERYHAYDYGWRRVALNDFSEASPIDPESAWFRPQRVEQTETMWRRHFGERRRDRSRLVFEPPATASREQIERWEYEQRELGKLRPAVATEEATGIVKGPAVIAYVELASRFVRENVERWGAQNRAVRNAMAAADPRDLAAIQAGLGLSATEAAE